MSGDELFPAEPDDLPYHDPVEAGLDPWGTVEPTGAERAFALILRLNRGGDRALGAVVDLFDQRGRFAIGDVLEVSRLRFQFAKWGEYGGWALVELAVEVPAWGYDLIDHDVLNEIRDLVNDMIPDRVQAEYVRCRLVPPTSDWRTDRAEARGDGSQRANQALFTASADWTVEDRLRFANQAEVVLYRALKAMQATLPPNETIGIMPGPGFRTVARTFGPDMVVTYRGRAIGLEVDGSHHARRYAADRSRDDLLKDAGLIDVIRIPVEDTNDPAVVEQHMQRLMTRLRG